MKIERILKKATRLAVAFTLRPFINLDTFNNHTGNHKLLDIRQSISPSAVNEKIKSLINQENPFMIARFGSEELRSLLKIEKLNELDAIEKYYSWAKTGTFPFSRESFSTLQKNAGFFPINKKSLLSFHEEMMESIPQVDILASWIDGESRYNDLLQYADVCTLESIEPYFYANPWSTALENKKVLVIHPFTETIKKQFNEKRKYLFPQKNILPDFHLSCVKAVQTIAENPTTFKSWFSALDYMTEQALNKDFDIAILGCGAYGFPLAARLKRAGKKAIHLGGATQLLFGIKGSRWDTRPQISKLYNENWVRPSETETPKNFSSIENGCYW